MTGYAVVRADGRVVPVVWWWPFEHGIWYGRHRLHGSRLKEGEEIVELYESGPPDPEGFHRYRHTL